MRRESIGEDTLWQARAGDGLVLSLCFSNHVSHIYSSKARICTITIYTTLQEARKRGAYLGDYIHDECDYEVMKYDYIYAV